MSNDGLKKEKLSNGHLVEDNMELVTLGNEPLHLTMYYQLLEIKNVNRIVNHF